MLLICGMLLACAPSAFAWSYHSFAYGYSISLPDDWTHVPEEVLAAETSQLPKTGAIRGRIDAAFQAKRGAAIDYPFILVEVLPYSQHGYPQQVDDREIEHMVRGNTGLDPSNPFNSNTQILEGGAEREPLEGALSFDAEGRRFTWSSADSGHKGDLIHRVQWGFFGKEMLVHVTLFERGKGSDRLRDMAEAVAGSFKFEIGKEYQPAFTISDAAKIAGQMMAAPNMGVVVTFLCVGTAVLFAVIAMVTNRGQQQPVEQYSIFDRER